MWVKEKLKYDKRPSPVKEVRLYAIHGLAPATPAPNSLSTCMAPAGSSALWRLGGLSQWEPLAGDQRKGVGCVWGDPSREFASDRLIQSEPTTDLHSPQGPFLYTISRLQTLPSSPRDGLSFMDSSLRSLHFVLCPPHPYLCKWPYGK